MMTVYEKARANGYRNTDEYPSKPALPALLRKSGKEMTDEDIHSLAQVRGEYDAAVAKYEADRVAYREKDAALGENFERDLAIEEGLLAHPKRHLLFQKAWEHGHSAGHSEVAIYYADLAELLKD